MPADNIVECSELIHTAHRVPLLACTERPGNPTVCHIPHVRTLLEPCQLQGREHCPGDPVNGSDSAPRNVESNSFGMLSIAFKEFCLRNIYILQYNLLVNKADLERSVVCVQHEQPHGDSTRTP